MTRHPRTLTDRTALARRRARATADGLFLHRATATDLHSRLQEVNRTFQTPAVICGQPDFWQAEFPEATVVTDDPVLTLTPDRHDLVIHALCLHWADDPVGQLIQARRALVEDGLLLVNCFGGETLAELRSALAEAETRVSGGLSPRVLPMADIRDLGALMQRAGLALPVSDRDRHEVSYADMHALMRDLRAMGETNALSGRLRHPTRPAVFHAARDIYADRFAGPDGRYRATFEIITLSGWSPAASQPVPLRPGSAKTSLASALGTRETPLKPRADD